MMLTEHARLIDSNSDNEFRVFEPSEMIKQLSSDQKNQIVSVKDRILQIESEINALTLEKEQCLEHLARISCHIVADRARNSTTFVHRVSLEKKSTQIIDVIKAMCRGTQFLKFGNRGRPHYHQFEVTSDHQYLRWYSRKKKKEKWKTAIKIENILHFQNGHLYKEALADARYHERAFSISYRDLMKNKTKTLEVVARTKTDFQIWSKGFELILKRIRDAKRTNEHYIVQQHFPKESFMEIHRRNQKHFERKLAKKTDPTRQSVERCLTILETRYDTSSTLRDVTIRNRDSQNYGAMDAIMLASDRLANMGGEIEQIRVDLRGGNRKLSVLNGLIHELIIEVQCLEEKLFVIC